MKYLLFLHNGVLFSHQLDVPFISWLCMIVILSITTQIPLFNDFPLTIRKPFKLAGMNHCMFSTSKHTMAHLFTLFLRFATAPCANRRSFSTFTHNDCNVMRGRRPSLRHSVKHYKAPGLKNTYCVITSFFLFLCAKIVQIERNAKKKIIFLLFPRCSLSSCVPLVASVTLRDAERNRRSDIE